MKVIINIGKIYGSIDGVFTKNSEIKILVYSKLKQNKAKKLIDNENTLMYEILD